MTPGEPPASPPDPVDPRAEIEDLRAQVQFLRAAHVARDPRRAAAVAAVRRPLGVVRRRLRAAAGRTPPPAQAGHGHFRPYRVRAAPTAAGTRPRPRVLHVLANMGTGGSARLVVDLVEHLSADLEHAVLSRTVPEAAGYAGLDLRALPQLTGPAPVRGLLRTLRPALLHVHYVADDPRTPWGESDWRWYHHVFTAAEREGVPVVENLNIPVPPYVSDAVSSYVHVSGYVAGRFGPDRGRNAVIHPGSDTDFFAPAPGAAPPDDCAGMVYRLDTDKLGPAGIDPLIELVRRRPASRGLVVGGGQLLEPYRTAVARAGAQDAIAFPGYVAYEDLPGWYGRMAVVLAPVVRESFGQVVPFAMSMGLPVVAYAVGALPEILGDDGMLVEPGDAAGMAELVAGLLDDRPRRLEIGRRNRERAVARFSLPAMIEAYRTLYAELVRT